MSDHKLATRTHRIPLVSLVTLVLATATYSSSAMSPSSSEATDREGIYQEGRAVTPAPASIPPSRLHEELIAEASPSSDVIAIRVAPTGEPRVAWVEKGRAGHVVRLDGRQVGGVYDEVRYLAFLGDRLTLIGERNSKMTLIAGGAEVASNYTKITAPDVSVDGRLAAGVCRERRCRLLLDGRETGPEFDDISAPDFSPKGDRSIYFGKRARKWVAVIDGQEAAPVFDDWATHAWGADGTRIAVAAYDDTKARWIVDGQPGPLFDVIGNLAFSPDGRHFAYGAATASRGLKKQDVLGLMVVDGIPLEKTYTGKGMPGGWTYLFGTGQHIAKGLKNLSPDFHGVSDPVYTSTGELVFAQRLGDGNVVVRVGERTGPAFDNIVSPIIVTPDGQHIAYVAERGQMFVEVSDERPGATVYAKREVSRVEWIGVSDNGELAYELVRGGSEFKAGRTRRALRRIVVNGGAGPEYDALNIIYLWSPDARHHAYVVQGAEGTRDRAVVDGLVSPLYDDVSIASLRFPEGALAQFVSRQGRRFLSVTIDAD